MGRDCLRPAPEAVGQIPQTERIREEANSSPCSRKGEHSVPGHAQRSVEVGLEVLFNVIKKILGRTLSPTWMTFTPVMLVRTLTAMELCKLALAFGTCSTGVPQSAMPVQAEDLLVRFQLSFSLELDLGLHEEKLSLGLVGAKVRSDAFESITCSLHVADSD